MSTTDIFPTFCEYIFYQNTYGWLSNGQEDQIIQFLVLSCMVQSTIILQMQRGKALFCPIDGIAGKTCHFWGGVAVWCLFWFLTVRFRETTFYSNCFEIKKQSQQTRPSGSISHPSECALRSALWTHTKSTCSHHLISQTALSVSSPTLMNSPPARNQTVHPFKGTFMSAIAV